MSDEPFQAWTIYKNPRDYPGCYVVRRGQAILALGIVHDLEPTAVCHSLVEAREAVPPGRVRMDRHPDDDPVIVETWI